MKKVDYGTLSTELSEVLARLQEPDIRVDQAVELYEKGLQLVGQLETYLKAAENKVEQLKLQQTSSSDN